ncbi:MAG: hypothetical protein ACREWE_10845 [Gammaproteobacteria bacterium]
MFIASHDFWTHTGTPGWCPSRHPGAADTGADRQSLPGEDGMDGFFFYVPLQKAEGPNTLIGSSRPRLAEQRDLVARPSLAHDDLDAAGCVDVVRAA